MKSKSTVKKSAREPAPLWELDFASAFERQPQEALLSFQALLLDEKELQRRIVFLRLLAQRTQVERLEREPPRHDFQEEIAIIGRLGAINAVRENRIEPDRLIALSCDPDALLEAHAALTRETTIDPPTGDTPLEFANDAETMLESPLEPEESGFDDRENLD